MCDELAALCNNRLHHDLGECTHLTSLLLCQQPAEHMENVQRLISHRARLSINDILQDCLQSTRAIDDLVADLLRDEPWEALFDLPQERLRVQGLHLRGMAMLHAIHDLMDCDAEAPG